MEYNFSYENRFADIENRIASFNEVTQLFRQNPDLITNPDTVKSTMKMSLVIAIYSLSEQLLKNSLYSVLNVNFNEENQGPHDKFILNRMSPNTLPMTPTIERIEQEHRILFTEFKLYIPPKIKKYQNKYEQLLKARHGYAHSNEYVDNVDYDATKHFVGYLKIHYDNVNMFSFRQEIANFVNLFHKFRDDRFKYSTFDYFFRDTVGPQISSHFEEITKYYEEFETNNCLDDIYDVINDNMNLFNNLSEENFQEDREQICELIKEI
ncbi:hypothetical protein [Streptococcus mitis]|uniref:RiboL-PSP-HEPN domain-containing protein n=1 Tax=Streptococcus mitis TaxID=28037 RepID=A0A3R9MSG9_STRMT|nr:hypothetical protein [Streptococcus mitis]RSJ89321.1 hypothetical protein D8788_09055 [Streptococcus mitis]